MSNDLRYAFRSLLKNPGFAVVAIITLALGVGANTAIFSVVNGVLLRPLPYPDAASIVQVWPTSPDDPRSNHSAADFLDLQRGSRSLQTVAGYREEPIMVWVNGGEPVRIRGAIVTADYFEVFGVPPIAGRDSGRVLRVTHGAPRLHLPDRVVSWGRDDGGQTTEEGERIHIDRDRPVRVGPLQEDANQAV